MAHRITEMFDEQEFNNLKLAKGKNTWREFLLWAAREKVRKK